MPIYGPNLDIASNGPWEFALITELPGGKARYTPKSGALLCIDKFPHLIIEVFSEDSQPDHFRMLLQAACVARLGNKLRQSPVHPFIVSAIYIDDDLCTQWHFTYQPLAADLAVS